MTNENDRSDGTESGEHRSYRLAARAWLAGNLEPLPVGRAADGPRDGETERQFALRSRSIQRSLFDAGYAGITLPEELGGQALSGRHQQIFAEESAGYERPGGFGGTFGPVLGTLMEHMAPDYRRAHVRGILSGQELWAQLMSEPGAGSDIGGITTTAVRDGDEWSISGQKVWTTAAHLSDFAICLTRTDWEAPKYNGLTMFFVSLHSPGLEIRPLRQLNGGSEFCEVFLDQVKVPDGNVLGQVNAGWSTVHTWLSFEHGGLSVSGDSSSASAAGPNRIVESAIPHELIAIARSTGKTGNPVVRDLLASVFVAEATQTLFSERTAERIRSGASPVQSGAGIGVRNARIRKRYAEIAAALSPASSMAWAVNDPEGGHLSNEILSTRRLSIAGGTDEVNLNNIAERVLGLPREPSVDRGIPFREVRVNRLAHGKPVPTAPGTSSISPSEPPNRP